MRDVKTRVMIHNRCLLYFYFLLNLDTCNGGLLYTPMLWSLKNLINDGGSNVRIDHVYVSWFHNESR